MGQTWARPAYEGSSQPPRFETPSRIGAAAAVFLPHHRRAGVGTVARVTTTRDYPFVPGPVGPTIVGGDGSWLLTDDGRRILDGGGGAIVANIGHGRAEVADAVRDAMANGAYVLPTWPTPHRLALLDELRQHWLPAGMDHVFFTTGGSESADSAIRLAHAYQSAVGKPERWKVVGRHPSYHGVTLGTLAMGSHDRRRQDFGRLLLDFPKIPWDDAEAAVKIIEQEDPATIAAVVFEPMTGSAGACLEASDHYWRTIAEVCREHDILLIADEVMTGFGRTGLVWGHDHLPLQPDVIYGGKGLGGGYVPMGMVAAGERVVAPLADRGFFFFTFSAVDGMCAGATAALQVLRREHLVERSAAMGEVLRARLVDALGDHPHVAEIRGRGLFHGLELVADRATGEPFPMASGLTNRVIGECMARDLWVYPAGSGPVQDAVMVGPPFVIDHAEVETLVERLAEAIGAATAAGASS